jgi:ABC-type Fe3+/spermidine/putrescine transport system ATPase subunit
LDEVLAVGDSEFQKKCLDKIENLCHKEGRTIVFVSHNQPIIERLCSKVFYLKNGMLHMEGATNEIMPIYMRDQYKNSSDTKTTNNIAERSRIGNGKVIITDVKFLNKKNQVVDAFTPGESLEILVNYKSISYEYKRIKNLILGVPIFNNQGIFVSDLNNKMSSHEFKDAPLEGQIAVKIPKLPLMRGLYKFGFCLEIDYALADQFVDNIELCVTEGDYYSSGYSNSLGRQGIYIDQNWTISV